MRWLYLHGFASGPASSKGVALADRLARRNIRLERLDLRRPSLEHLRLSAMMDEVRRAMGDAQAILFGSSLGGLCAARVAEAVPAVQALVLLAPAFRLVERWRARMGEAEWQRWRDEGWLEIDDYAEKRRARVDFGFIEEAARIDVGLPEVKVPTLIVHGTRDETCDIAVSRELARGRPNVRLVEVDDGHELVASLDRIDAEAQSFLKPWAASEGSGSSASK